MSTQWEGPELLQPITAEQPCGENLEDSQLMSSFDAFRLFGQAGPLDPAPEWAVIRDKSLEALAKSKDLRLLAHLGAALLRTDGLPAFCTTLTVASKWLDAFWADAYPRIDEDAILRRNALNCFADQVAVIDGVRRVPLVSSRQHGRFTLRDIEVASGQVPAGDSETRPDEGQIKAAFSAAPLEELRGLREQVAAAIGALKSIDDRMRAEGGPEAAPTFDALSTQLGRIDKTVLAQMALRPDGAGADAASEGQSGSGPSVTGAIRSRQDAIRALDAVSDFFRQTEPSSPIPLIVDRAKRLVSKDFLEVLADVAPDAVAQAKAAGGLKS